MEASLYADAVRPFEDETRRLRPSATEVIDAHTHLGLDEDGRSLDPDDLLAMLDAAGARRACVFALHDPERHPAYRIPNDRVLSWAAETDGRLVPFCRLDPADDPLREGERCLAAGARGIKLHPRAQAFAFAGDAIAGIFSLAGQARVPILIHAGRGLPPIADGLTDLALRHPDVVLILAHAAIADQAVLTSRLADHPGVLYDISCFSTVDVLELFARASAERVVFASDPPYGYPAASLYAALRVARALNLDEGTTRLFLGGTMAGLIDGRGLPEASPPRGSSRLELSGPLLRVFNYCTMSGPAIFQRDIATARGPLELALATCRDPHPGTSGPALEDIGRALSAAIAMLEDDGSVMRSIDLMHRCMSRAVTEPV